MKVGKGILVPIGNVSESLELVLSLVITPFLINVIWFWLVDNFLMKVRACVRALVRSSRRSYLPCCHHPHFDIYFDFSPPTLLVVLIMRRM